MYANSSCQSIVDKYIQCVIYNYFFGGWRAMFGANQVKCMSDIGDASMATKNFQRNKKLHNLPLSKQ